MTDFDSMQLGNALAINLAPMADSHDKHHETVVLDRGHNPDVADAVPPKPLSVAGQHMAEPARIVAAGDPLAQVA